MALVSVYNMCFSWDICKKLLIYIQLGKKVEHARHIIEH